MDHHRAQRDRYKRTTDMHQQRSPWKQTTDMESTWIIMEHLTTGMMDYHGNRHDGHHGNRHDGSPWEQQISSWSSADYHQGLIELQRVGGHTLLSLVAP